MMEEYINSAIKTIENSTCCDEDSEDDILDAIKNILFEPDYMQLLKDMIKKLHKQEISQKKLKQLILQHGLNSAEHIKRVIRFYFDVQLRKIGGINTSQNNNKHLIEYKEILAEIAPRIEKIYEKLSVGD